MSLNRDIFVLFFGRGRGGTSAFHGFLNLSQEISMAFEGGQDVIDGRKTRRDLLNARLPYSYNANKIALNYFCIPAEKFIEAYEKRILIIHDRFSDLKVLFMERDPVQAITSFYLRLSDEGKPIGLNKTMAINVWRKTGKIIDDLKSYFKSYFDFNFEDFLKDDSLKKEIYNYIGIKYEDKFAKIPIRTGIYGTNPLSISSTRSISNDEFIRKVRKSIENKFNKEIKL